MKKTQLALKILLPVLVILLVVLITLQIKCVDLHNDNESALIGVILILLNIIPMIAMIILGVALLVDFIFLVSLKKNKGAVISALVMMCLLLPFVGFSVFVDIAAADAFVELPIISVAVFAVNLAALVLSGIEVNRIRKSKQQEGVQSEI